MILIKIVKFIIKFIIYFLILIALYFLTAHIFTLFPSKKYNMNGQVKKEIFILYNKMHSDIILKTNSLNIFSKNYLNDVIQNRDGYLAFGWGDKETYLNTPTWNEIKLSTTVKALFINTPSVIHVQFYKEIKKFKNLKIVKVSYKQKELLIENIFNSFNIENINKIDKGYGKNDLFYPSIDKYNLFNTCNTWTGKKLRESNISISYWTPFSYNVIESLP